MTWLALLHYYSRFSGYIAYLYLLKNRIKISLGDLILIWGIVVIFTAHLLDKTFVNAVIDFRFFWGWVIFYLIFKNQGINKIKIEKILILLCLLTLSEAVLINTLVQPFDLPNYPNFEDGKTEWVSVGLYQRPYSFGASASVGSSLLVALIAMCKPRGWKFFLSILSVLVFGSGVGILLLAVILFAVYCNLRMKIFISIVILAAAVMITGSSIIDFETNIILRKIDIDYILLLINLKLESISTSYSNLSLYEYYFGKTEEFVAGDFGFLGFALGNGLIGLVLFLYFLISKINKINRAPMFVMVVASFHYPTIFFLPGQLIFGLVLNYGRVIASKQGRYDT